MKKNVFKLFSFLTLFALIFFASCENDFDEVNVENPNAPYKIKIVYGENFFKEHPEIRSELKSKPQLSSQARMISSDYNFEIDETKVQIIETEAYDVFTFEIERDSLIDNVLENYILIQHANNSIKHFIASYPYNIVNGKKVFTSDASIIEITNPNLVYSARSVNEHIANPNCFWIKVGSITYMQYVEPENCPCEGHSFGQACTCSSGQPTPGGYQEFEHIFWSYQCNSGGGSNSGSIPSGSGSGGSGGGSKSNEDIITVPFDKDIDFQLENPDCEELKKNAKDSLFRQNMQFLKTDLLTSDLEKGFQIYNGNYITPPFAENPVVGPIVSGTAQHTPQSPYHISMKAIVHNHLKETIHNHIGTFTPNDIIQLLNLNLNHQQQNSPVTQSEMASYLVCNEGNYVLKISDYSKLYLFANKYVFDANFKKEVDDFYKEKNIVHGKPKIDQNIGFLKLLKKYDFGVKLFEGDENFQNWEELELNNSGNKITKKPC
jgi:hypothetical protein